MEGVTIKNPTKVDNLFFRQIDGYMEQVFSSIRAVYEKPTMTQYSMKTNIKEEVPKLKKATTIKEDDFQRNNLQNIMHIKSKIQRSELDLRDTFTNTGNLRLLVYV